MTNQQLEINQPQKPIEGYRGTLVYRQEYGYKLITMMIDLRTPDERSRVTSWAYDFDNPEEAERLPAGSPLASVDLYRFPAIDGMEIELTIRSQEGEYIAHYLVAATGVEERSSFLWLDVMKARDSHRERKTMLPDRVYDVRSEAGEKHEAIQQY
jgi:hypothetical protein